MAANVVYVQTPGGLALPRFSISPMLHLSTPFLETILEVAATSHSALLPWACGFESVVGSTAGGLPVYTFDEKEWAGLAARPAPHRLDVYTVTRGLYKCFDTQYPLSIAFRQQILRSIFEQHTNPNSLRAMPHVVSHVIQLALFDQVVYT